MAGSVALKSVPPVTLPPAFIFSITGFQILAPGGESQALPNFQVLSSNLPWFRAPAGALSMAWLSSPALAARGYLAMAAATSSSLAWLKAATVPSARAAAPTSATAAADIIFFMEFSQRFAHRRSGGRILGATLMRAPHRVK